LKVTDSDGKSTQVQRSITIADEAAPEPNNLDVAPVGVASVIAFPGSPVTQTLSVRSSGEGVLDWTASENIPWLTLDTNAGDTPTDPVATIDPSGMPVGTFNGTITFTSTQAVNSPFEVNVTLQVTGQVVYLPLIMR
jgi:hypothetical protein